MARYFPIACLIMVAFMLVHEFSQRPDDPLLIKVDGNAAYLNGVTTGRSEGAIKRLVRDHPEVDTLVFETMPGTQDVMANTRLARTIRDAGLTTQMTAQSRIASGAVDLFIAGERRIGACGAMIGVHAWGIGGYDAQDALWDTHRPYLRAFLSDMGLDPDFYDFRTEAAGTEAIHWMSTEEINHWRMTSQPLDCG